PPAPPPEPLATVAPPDATPAPKESAGRPGPGTSQPPRPASRAVKGTTAPGDLSPRTDGTPAVGGTVRSMGTRPAGEDEEAPRKPLVRKLPVSILVRPYGSIRVDDGAPSAQPLQKHDVEVTPGRHTVTISCDYCEDVVDTIDVQPDGDNVFHLRAQPKASRLSVDFEPAGALVRVGDEFRSAEDSVKTPFEVRSPRGPAGFQHTVVVEVSHPGYVPERRVVHLRPGEPTTLRGSLRPE
ncbi:serine/threonine protein kinase, partial [Myxococcus xanthus]|nr:serine/threonine protein kinase [Myxococcus xanthus]